uniref:Lectin C-type domain n=1 Tax=Glyptapanteles indiensis TaxID=92994 RepID=A0JCU0_GLYIN|nr:Lectin C-type domain [Glyptapanteles indiensis]
MNKFAYLMLLPLVLGQDLLVSRNRGRATIGVSKSYEFHTTPATFEDARKICKQQGGDLAIITSQDEEHKLLDLWSNSGPILSPSNGYDKQVFIGVNNLRDVNRWETIEGESLPYDNWSSWWADGRQPSRPNEQRCGSLLRQGGMDDVECYLKLGFICESS